MSVKTAMKDARENGETVDKGHQWPDSEVVATVTHDEMMKTRATNDDHLVKVEYTCAAEDSSASPLIVLGNRM